MFERGTQIRIRSGRTDQVIFENDEGRVGTQHLSNAGQDGAPQPPIVIAQREINLTPIRPSIRSPTSQAAALPDLARSLPNGGLYFIRGNPQGLSPIGQREHLA